MDNPGNPSESNLCISDLAFDRLIAGEVSPELRERMRQHEASCVRCQTRHTALELSRDIAIVAPFESVVARAQTPSKSRRPRNAYYWLSAAALVVCCLFVARTRLAPPDSASELRAKGSVRFGFYVKRGELVTQGGPRDILLAGDQIQFTYVAPRPGYFAVVSRDGARHVTVYYPSGLRAAPIASGQQMLPLSTRLDDVLGKETIFALFCAQPVELEPIRSALERDPVASPNAPGCDTEVLNVEKRHP